jgi:hypothetical protein
METGNGNTGILLRIFYNSVLRLLQQIHLSWRFSETVNGTNNKSPIGDPSLPPIIETVNESTPQAGDRFQCLSVVDVSQTLLASLHTVNSEPNRARQDRTSMELG